MQKTGFYFPWIRNLWRTGWHLGLWTLGSGIKKKPQKYLVERYGSARSRPASSRPADLNNRRAGGRPVLLPEVLERAGILRAALVARPSPRSSARVFLRFIRPRGPRIGFREGRGVLVWGGSRAQTRARTRARIRARIRNKFLLFS